MIFKNYQKKKMLLNQEQTLFTLCQQLPQEIVINCVAPYTYQSQPKQLCDDIRDYTKSKQEMIYAMFDVIVRDDLLDAMEYEFELYDLIVHQLLYFINNKIPLVNGLDDNFYKILYRHVMYQNQTEIVVDTNPYYDNIRSTINCFWGLLTLSERGDFVNYLTNELDLITMSETLLQEEY